MWSRSTATSLRRSLALSLAFGMFVVLALLFLGLHELIKQELNARLNSRLLADLDTVSAYAIDHPGAESIGRVWAQFTTRSHVHFFQVWDYRGRTLARSESSLDTDLPRLQSDFEAPRFYDIVLPDGDPGRAVIQTYELPVEDLRGALIVMAAEETASIRFLHDRLDLFLVLGTLVAMAASVLIAHFTVNRSLRPLDEFAQMVERVDLEGASPQLDSTRLPIELQPAARKFAALLDLLLEALARERRYARNVAHELRTPIAELQLLADVGMTAKHPDDARESLREIAGAASELRQIVDSLLAMTRYEAGLEKPQLEPVDLADELRGLAASLRLLAAQRQHSLELSLPRELWIHTDPILLRRLLTNLIANALVHAPVGTSVAVRLAPSGDLSVTNPAPHLTPQDLPRLSERFFTIPSGDRAAHAGLGLSLAAAIAKLLQLHLDLRFDDSGLLTASVGGFAALPKTEETVE